MTSGIGLEPDRDRLRRDAAPRLLAHEGAAAGCQHDGAAVEQTRDHAGLAVAEMRLAVALEDFRYGHAGRRLDLGVGIDEGQLEPDRHAAADRGFAYPHHADEHDRARAQRRQDVGLGRSLDRQRGVGHLSRSNGSRSNCRQRRHALATYTTPKGASPEDSCHETANMLDDFIG
ncbi:hypothetical protein ACVWW7_003322 [Bradyrhizobium sp. LM6.9]